LDEHNRESHKRTKHVLLLLLICSVYAEDKKLLVVSSAEELKLAKSRKII